MAERAVKNWLGFWIRRGMRHWRHYTELMLAAAKGEAEVDPDPEPIPVPEEAHEDACSLYESSTEEEEPRMRVDLDLSQHDTARDAWLHHKNNALQAEVRGYEQEMQAELAAANEALIAYQHELESGNIAEPADRRNDENGVVRVVEFEELDTNKDGVIDRTEFERYAMQQPKRVMVVPTEDASWQQGVQTELAAAKAALMAFQRHQAQTPSYSPDRRHSPTYSRAPSPGFSSYSSSV